MIRTILREPVVAVADCKVCGEPRDMGDHAACRASLLSTARRGRSNLFVPPEVDDPCEDLRDVDIYIPAGELP